MVLKDHPTFVLCQFHHIIRRSPAESDGYTIWSGPINDSEYHRRETSNARKHHAEALKRNITLNSTTSLDLGHVVEVFEVNGWTASARGVVFQDQTRGFVKGVFA